MTQIIFATFDWTYGTGTTPTSKTGPDAAFEGNGYMFIESSGKDETDFAV